MPELQLYDKIKTGELKPESLLWPERHICDVQPSSLRTKVMTSGFSSLDEYGFLKETKPELIVVAARPGGGKTAFMMQICEHVAQKKPVLFFSLEMERESLLTRMLSNQLNVSQADIESGVVSDTEISTAIAIMRGRYSLYVDDRTNLNIEEIQQSAIDFKSRHGLGLVCIDYLQLIKPMTAGPKHEVLGDVSFGLKKLARALSIPVIAGCQTNRSSAKRADEGGSKKPRIHDIAASGSIEQDADKILAISRPCLDDETASKNDCTLHIIKNRNGKTGEINVDFDGSRMVFTDRTLEV